MTDSENSLTTTLLISYHKYTSVPYRLPRAILRFIKHGATLQRFLAVPLAGGNIQYNSTVAHVDGLYQHTIPNVEILFKMTTKAF